MTLHVELYGKGRVAESMRRETIDEPDELTRLEKAILRDYKVGDCYSNSPLVRAVILRPVRATGELSPSERIRSLSKQGAPMGPKCSVRHPDLIAAILLIGVLILAVWSLYLRGPRGPVVARLTGVPSPMEWGSSGLGGFSTRRFLLSA
jgi:hypothetical protein